MANDRLAGAYLLHGPEGVGKRTLAEITIGFAVCARPGPEAPCGLCPDCRMAAAGVHPDVRRLDGAEGRLGINEVRGAQAALAYRPRGPGHVLLIDPADQLTLEAANALLKTLEEPEGAPLFILVSAYPERIPLTVRSRCVRIPFRRLTREEIQRGLEMMGYMGPEAGVAAALAEGSLGRAREMADGKEHLAIRDEAVALARRIPGLRPAEISVIARQMGTRAAMEKRLRALLVWYRDVLFWGETGAPDLVVNTDRLDQIGEAAARHTARELAGMIGRIDEALRMLGAYGNPGLIAEVLLLGLSGKRRARVFGKF